MIRIRAISGVLIILLFWSTSVFAQNQAIADRVVKNMTEGLGLSPDQVKKIAPIILNNIIKRQSLMTHSKSLKEMKAKMNASIDEETKELIPLLNNAQVIKLEAQLSKEMMSKPKNSK